MTQHVIQRGNNRTDIFRAASDCEVFLYILREAARRFHLEVHSYALMTTHVHLMATPTASQTLGSMMQMAGSRYAMFFNRHYERTGTLFEGRYRSFAIETEEYWYACMRYIEQNPVRAGIVSSPGDYRWSSFQTNAMGRRDRLVTPHPLYVRLGDTSADRCEKWKAICEETLPEHALTDIRLAMRIGVLGAKPTPPATRIHVENAAQVRP